MKSNFIYPTKKNVLIGFLTFQLFPILVLAYTDGLSNLKLWFGFELVIIGALILWRLKPNTELDEREKNIDLKWKGRLIDYGANVFFIPIIALALKPEIEAWTLYLITSIPAYMIYVLCSLLAKKEIGYYFYRKEL